MPVRALILDASPVTLAFMERVLAESLLDELQCDALATAAEALTRIKESQSYDVALIDLDTPSSGSTQVLGALHQTQTLKVVYTLYADDEALVGAARMGIDGYLLKEERIECAVEALQRIIRGRPALSPFLARRLSSLAPQASRWAGRELELLELTAKGFTPKEIAQIMGLHPASYGALVRGLYRSAALPAAATSVAAA